MLWIRGVGPSNVMTLERMPQAPQKNVKSNIRARIQVYGRETSKVLFVHLVGNSGC